MKTLPYIATWLVLIIFSLPLSGQSPFEVINLKTEYATTPLGLEAKTPRFSWQMKGSAEERGLTQSAYQVLVTSENGTEVWNSGKIASGQSLGVSYGGQPLRPTTRYRWQVTLWDQQGRQATADTWFETGLMNPDPALSAWHGAKWIGGGDEDLVLFSHALSVFKINYTLQLDKASGSTKSGFVLGANDSRLMDKNLNLMGVENGRNESYIHFELDISAVDGTPAGLAKFNIYRVGYTADDKKDVPFKSYDLPLTLINNGNKYDAHQVFVESNFGIFQIYINGTDEAHQLTKADAGGSPFAARGLNLNPVGRGNDYICFPLVADIGFYAAPDQKAAFSKVEIRNYRYPSNALFSEKLQASANYQGAFKNFVNGENGLSISNGAYLVDGGNNGRLLIANPSRNAAPMLRTTFSAQNKKLTNARLYVTARGIYEMYINGQRVGNDYFTPGLTQYNKTHMYQTYDVTSLVRSGGSNAIGAWLSEGWWSGNITYSGDHWNFFGDRQSLLAQLVMTYDDGSEQMVVTDPGTWKLFTDGPVRNGSFFQGEVYDGSKEQAISGWATASYNDNAWKAAVEVPLEGTAYMGSFETRFGTTTFNYDDLQMVAQMGNNPTIVKTLTAQSVTEVRPGVFVYDMGQNMVGIPMVRIRSGRPGQQITMRYAEVKYPDLPEHGDQVGMVMMENIRAALAHDKWTLKGGDETLQPRFTFHGYRYVEITGIDQALPLQSVQGQVISSITGLASSYQTSNPLVNKLWENITWSLRGNFLSIPTDTPARNERMGWSGDINVFSRASTYLADADLFLRRHLLAMRDMQREDGRFTDVAPVGGGFGGTLWGSAGMIIPWELYRQYGDTAVLQEHYKAMQDYIAFLDSKTDPESGILNEGPLGDWLSPENSKNDNTALWTAYQVYDLEIMARTAEVLGKSEDATSYWKKYEDRKAFFNKTYIDPSTHLAVKSGAKVQTFGPPPQDAGADKGKPMDTQAAYAIPLALGVFNDENRPYAVQKLAATVERENTDDGGTIRPAYSLMTGFIGTASLNQALSENGRDDLAYRLLQQTTYPSWLYPVVNGATTIWERLNSYTIENGFGGNNSMNSFNHYSFGAVGAWMYNFSLGIQRDPKGPAFKHFLLKPTPDPTGQMTYASGHYDSVYGRIESSWKVEGGKLSYSATVPPNTTATLYLPTRAAKDIMEEGKAVKKSKGVKFVKMEGDRAVFELVAGRYEFTASR